MQSGSSAQWIARFTMAILALGTIPRAVAETPGALISDVRGSIRVAADGTVSEYHLDGAVPDIVRAGIDRSVAKWRFESILVNGVASAVDAHLFARLRAEPFGDGSYKIRLSDLRFGTYATIEKPLAPPEFPRSAMTAEIGADLALVALLTPEGLVANVHVQQVNLYGKLKNPKSAEKWRELFSVASRRAVSQWKFVIEDVPNGANELSFVTPMEFFFKGVYGWPNAGHAGPVTVAPWLDRAIDPDSGWFRKETGKGAIRDSRIILFDQHLRLLEDPVGTLL